MLEDSAQKVVEDAKQDLSKAVDTTASAEGNPTDSFGPHEFSKAQYHIPRGARKKKQ
jgi:hypothetical protein